VEFAFLTFEPLSCSSLIAFENSKSVVVGCPSDRERFQHRKTFKSFTQNRYIVHGWPEQASKRGFLGNRFEWLICDISPGFSNILALNLEEGAA
jgi:hypothetical protein